MSKAHLFVLDTDHATLYQYSHLTLRQRLESISPGQLATTIITYEEQVSGRLAVTRRARTTSARVESYYRLQQTLGFFCQIPVLPLNDTAATTFQRLLSFKLRIGTQDLLIAAITLSSGSTLLSRNLRDFRQVPGLVVEDWSVPSG
jgi:tRNA(fMet)-specific endonuclease VapC